MTKIINSPNLDHDLFIYDLNYDEGEYCYYNDLEPDLSTDDSFEDLDDDWDDDWDDLEDEDRFAYADGLSLSELNWARNRQDEWYAHFRAEFGLTSSDYVDEQDLLDWLSVNFEIKRNFNQEI